MATGTPKDPPAATMVPAMVNFQLALALLPTEMVPCRSTGRPDFWYGWGKTAEERAEALSIATQGCRRCPLREMCLRAAVANDERYGIWGGLDRGARKRHTARIQKPAVAA